MGRYWSDTLNTNQSVNCYVSFGNIGTRRTTITEPLPCARDTWRDCYCHPERHQHKCTERRTMEKRTPSKSAVTVASTTAVDAFKLYPRGTTHSVKRLISEYKYVKPLYLLNVLKIYFLNSYVHFFLILWFKGCHLPCNLMYIISMCLKSKTQNMQKFN